MGRFHLVRVEKWGCMKFSLVLATLGRTTELQQFLRSLDSQRYRSFELIVVDQNEDDRLISVLAPYKEQFFIVHLRSAKGLSRARNVGLKHITGDLVAFPDDDCWYPDDLLCQVARIFSQEETIDGVTGRCIDEVTQSGPWTFPSTTQTVDFASVWYCGISITIFLRRAIVERVGAFDESLGVGAGTVWGAGEETDFLVRALRKGAAVRYDPALIVHHPAKTDTFDKQSLKRAFNYGCGWGRVARKHGYGIRFRLRALIRPAGGVLLSMAKLNPRRAAYHWNILRGRYFGLTAPKEDAQVAS